VFLLNKVDDKELKKVGWYLGRPSKTALPPLCQPYAIFNLSGLMLDKLSLLLREAAREE